MPPWHLFTLNVGNDKKIVSLVFAKGELFYIQRYSLWCCGAQKRLRSSQQSFLMQQSSFYVSVKLHYTCGIPYFWTLRIQ